MDDARPEDDAPVVPRPPEAGPATAPRRPLDLLGTAAVGVGMGTADLVPGFSGGTVALITGIYPRLIANVRQGARSLSLLVRGQARAALAALAAIEWGFVASLLLGILGAVFALATLMSHLLETRPVQMEAVFLGLIVGATVLAWRELRRPAPIHALVVLAVGALFFVLLGWRSGAVTDPSLAVFLVAGMVAICAMILPGISGSFLLLMLGMYTAVIDAVSDRDLVVIAVFGIGTVVGLAAFSTLLNWLLTHYHDLVLASMIGLMVGSVRVLWPWPPDPKEGVGDVRLHAPVADEWPVALGLAVGACLAVLAVGAVAKRIADRT
ncbi:MAG TPA: DUF368 domain-containing protein [Egicoccus sp.]|nr:DUF368 domain-containing protein [Egicoccus sp.]HSK25256.1 DUF368 domain-containing protein [Egicoccus sp.]